MQMVSDVPIGAFLSGGIDSSAVVASWRAHSDRPVKTYAIGFGGGDAERFYNELPYARQVAELLRHRPPRDPGQARRRGAAAASCCGTWTSRSPTPRSSRPIWCREFARRDVTVILSGVGGDELFGGYRRYLGDHYQALLRPAARLGCGARRRALGEQLPSDRHSPLLNVLRLRQGLPRRRRAAVRGALPRPTSRCSPRDARAELLLRRADARARRARARVRGAPAATTR